MPWQAVMFITCAGLIVLSLSRWASLNLTDQASSEKEGKSMRKVTNQFKLLASASIETIWAMDVSVVASILSS